MTDLTLGNLAVLTIKEPEQGLRALQGLNLPMGARWMALALAVCLSTLLGGIANILVPMPEAASGLVQLLTVPFSLSVMQFAALILSAFLMAHVGRMFGGNGTFADALLVTAWIEMLLVAVQAVQLVLVLVFPASVSILSIVAFGLFLYLTVMLTKALHGFNNPFLVILGLIGTMFVVGLALTILAVSFGLMPEIVAQ